MYFSFTHNASLQKRAKLHQYKCWVSQNIGREHTLICMEGH